MLYLRELSLPSRGAWIEMLTNAAINNDYDCRSPRGGRGLKYKKDAGGDAEVSSLPSRGAWIEIPRLSDMRRV